MMPWTMAPFVGGAGSCASHRCSNQFYGATKSAHYYESGISCPGLVTHFVTHFVRYFV